MVEKFSDQKDAESMFRGQKCKNRERNTGEKQNTEKKKRQRLEIVSHTKQNGKWSKEVSCSFHLDERQHGKGNLERKTTR